MHGRFMISGDARRFLSFEAACRAAKALSRQKQTASAELMWCDQTWKPKVCIGRATAGVWVATAEGRAWAAPDMRPR